MILFTAVSALVLAFQDAPPGNWDPTSPEDVARRAAESDGGSNSSTSDDPLKGPDVPSQPTGGRGRGGDMQMTMQPTVEGLLEARCGSCHGVDKQKGGLQIIPIARLHEGPEKFRVVKPGDPAGSLLLQRVKLPKGHDDIMPPTGDPLTAAEVKAIEDWINGGATQQKAKEHVAALNSGSKGRTRTTSARDFLRAYMSLKDLTSEQRKAGIDAAAEARKSLSAEDKKAMEEFRQMQRAMQDGDELPAELVARRQAIRSKIQEMEARAAELQNQLWSKLTPEQQATLRAALEERKKAAGRRNGRGQGRDKGPGQDAGQGGGKGQS
ncbi:MAG: hypothetical protein MK101_10645 [Phycisphaerales bacterium]|nr:hypothetical protein [Phycisphaerales bacterium]